MDQQEWIPLSEAVRLIADNCYPDEGNPRNTKKKARGRIEYARKNGLLIRHPDGSSWKYNRFDFLQWAASEWPELRNAISIPHIAKPPAGSVALEGFVAKGIAIDYPSDPKELKKRYSQCVNEIMRQDAEIRRLQVIESKWNEHLAKEERRRRKSRESGREGGRGKSK